MTDDPRGGVHMVWEEFPIDVDDTELVQAAFDAAARSDGIVRLEVGRVYRLSRPITMNHDGRDIISTMNPAP